MKFLRVLFILFLLFCLILGMIAYFVFRTPPLPDKAFLLVELGGEVKDYVPSGGISEIFGETSLSLYDYYRGLSYAKDDPSIQGVAFRIHSLSVGMAKLQELRTLIHQLKGKKTYAYLDTIGEFSPGNAQYYIASACESIILNPMGEVNLIGLHAEVPFLRGTLEKLHITPEMDHIGEYKTAMNLFTEKSFTEAHREMMKSLIDDFYQVLLEDIAKDRHLTPNQLETIINKGPMTAEEAKENHLVDAFAYWLDWKEKMKEDGAEWVNFRDYLRHAKEHGEKIAVIFGQGAIYVGEKSEFPFGGEEGMASDSVAKEFEKARKAKDIKAIVFRVDSPGGSAVASEIIRQALLRAKEDKPVVVSMSDVAGSGGYWVSMSADGIVANPSTLTGSIGVVVGKFNTRQFWSDLLGVTFDEISKGKHADFYSSLNSFTEEQKAIRTRLMEDIYKKFVRYVAKGRNLKEEEVDRIGRGRVWTGRQALHLKLVDQLGTLQDAVALAKKKAKIPPETPVKLVPYPRKKSFWETLIHKEKNGVWLRVQKLLTQPETLGPLWCPYTVIVR